MKTHGIKNTQNELERIAKDHEETQKKTDVASKNLEVQMRQLSIEFENLKRTGFFGTTVDNFRNENYKMMEVEKDEEKEIDPLVIESKVTEALKQMVKEWFSLRVMLQTRKVTKNQCCNSLLDYLFTPIGKPTYDNIFAVTKEHCKKYEDDS